MRFVTLLACCLVLIACTPGDGARLAGYRTAGELVVATRHDAISYRTNDEGNVSGFEHDLLQRLADRLDVPVRFVVYADSARALDAVITGKAHLAAAGLGRNDRLPVTWSPPLREVDYVLAGRAESADIGRESELSGRTVTARRGSVAAEALQQIRKRVPDLGIHLPPNPDEQDLLRRLGEGELDLVATDRVHFALAAQTHPALTIAYDLPVKTTIAWATPSEAEDDLAEHVAQFIGDAQAQGLIARTADRYFAHVRRLTDIDVSTFLERMKTRLPRYRAHFHEAQERTGIDWRFLAALAYQESQWDPLATSPTGVRGMMMLTSDTADRLGVADRLNARESILGGARYFAMMRDQLANDVPEPDRSWMAAAAYNLGMGHLNGARQIAQRMGKDHTDWWDMKTVLPLMSKPEFAARLKAGPARGGEAVIMAENIRNYHGILTRIEPPHQPALSPRGLRFGRDGDGSPRLTAPAQAPRRHPSAAPAPSE